MDFDAMYTGPLPITESHSQRAWEQFKVELC